MKCKVFAGLALSSISFLSNADTVNSVNGINIQLNSQAYSGAPINVALPLCLEKDSRSTIPLTSLAATLPLNSGGMNNPSPLPGVQITTCHVNTNGQKFSYINEQIVSSEGKCLTRLPGSVHVLEKIREEYVCSGFDQSKAPTGVKYGHSWEKLLSTNIALQTCSSGSENQHWIMDIANGTFQLKEPSGSCLSVSGRAIKNPGTIHSYNWVCPRGLRWGGLSRDVNQDNFSLSVESCDSPKTKFDFGSQSVMIIEKVLPIIIPM